MLDNQHAVTQEEKRHDPTPNDLTRRSFSALKWNYAGTAARVFSQLGFGILLARLLGPEPFGKFAVMLITTGIATVTVDLGLGAALVQKKQLGDDEIQSAFTWIMLSGTGVALLVASFSRPLAAMMNDPQLVPVFIGAAFFIVIQSFGTVSANLLKRRLDMRQLQVANLASYLLGFAVIGVSAALLGFGVWSLIAALLTQGLVYSTIVYQGVVHTLRPTLRVDTSALRHFGARIVPINLCNWIIENLDNVLVGRFFGMHALGLYAVSYNTVRTPTNHIVVTLQSVLFSAGSRVQDEQNRLQRIYLVSLSAVVLVIFPVFAGIASVSETVVLALFGIKWAQAAPLFAPLALAMLPHTVSAISGPVLWAKGEVGRDFRIEASVALTFVVVLAASAQVSLHAVVWCVFIIYMLRAILLAHAVLHTINLTWLAFFRAVGGSLLMGGVCALSIYLVDRLLAGLGVGAPYRLFADVATGACAYVITIVVCKRWVISKEVEWLFQRLSQDGSPSLHARVMRWILQTRKS